MITDNIEPDSLQRGQYPRPLALRATLLAALGLAVLSSLPMSRQAQAADEIDVDAIARNLDDFGARLQVLRSDIDKSRFDPDAMVDKLDYDPGPLIAFVQTDIAFQPYEGTLRGPAGAFRARAGNSLDQSVLLAYLLKSAGYDARIARGVLGQADALRLLQQTRNADTSASLEYLEDTLDKVLPASERGDHQQQDWADTALYRDARHHERLLREALAAGDVSLPATDAGAHWLPVVKQYFWVQHREGPSDPWQDAHPAFGNTQAPAAIEAVEFLADAVPAKYQHTLTMSAWVEQWRAGSIKKQRIMADWTRPTANLNGIALRYRNVPDGLNRETAAHLDEVVANSSMLIPMFNGALAPGALVFDLNGQTVDPFALSMGGAAGFFQTLGEKLASATGEVMDREDGQPALALHSMYLEFTHAAPSGDAQTRRRYLLTPRDDHRGDSKQLLWRLITDHSYMVATGGEPIDFVAERFLNTGIESMDWLEATVRKAFEPDIKIPLPADLPDDLPPLVQYWIMERRPMLDGKVITYRAMPGLLGIRRGYRDAKTAFAAVDVVWNRVEHVRVAGTGLQNLPLEAVSSGVWDTVLESVPARAMHRDPLSVSSTTRVFDLASEQGVKTVVLTPGNSKVLDGLPLDAVQKSFVSDDLQRGYAVVIPERVPAGVPVSGWWRVHTTSGDTLGMTGDGYGAEVTEYLMDVIGISKTLIGSVKSLADCEEQANNVAKMCCLVQAHFNNVAGLGFGEIMGAMLGSTTATLFDIMSTASENVTGQGLMPSANLSCEKMQATEW